MKIITVIPYFLTVFACAALAQTPEDASPVKAAVLALDRSYEAAFAKGDSAALASFFTEDAEHTTEDGTVLRGRAEIEKAISAGLKANKDAKLAIDLDTVRLLTPEVALENGTSTVTTNSGESSSALYTAIYVKKNGDWKISQLTESPLPPATARERLAELSWLIGAWSEKDGELNINSKFDWARGGNFITRNLSVKRGDEVTLEGWQIIGWDAAQNRIRSWTFDTEGGFSEGVWTRSGNSWLIRDSGTLPDGSHTTAEQTLTKTGDDKFTWEAHNRTLDGEPQPSIARFEINREKGN
jgi:uncharacterized protein (TIGR02246 family)